MASCILMAQLLGGPPLSASMSADARHAIERAHHRMTLALEAHGGKLQGPSGDDMYALFPSADAAALAACEMIERVYQLPPAHGTRFGARAAIDCATEDTPRHDINRLAEHARPAETLVSASAAALLTSSTRQFARAGAVQDALLGRDLVTLLRHTALAGSAGSDARQAPRLRVRHQGHTLYVDAKHPSLMLGREPDNDLVLDDPRASRRHARIDFRNNRFSLVDHSSNGSWVAAGGGKPIFIKGEEAELPPQGRIGLGAPSLDGDGSAVEFEVH